jgi:hypothetical protein
MQQQQQQMQMQQMQVQSQSSQPSQRALPSSQASGRSSGSAAPPPSGDRGFASLFSSFSVIKSAHSNSSNRMVDHEEEKGDGGEERKGDEGEQQAQSYGKAEELEDPRGSGGLTDQADENLRDAYAMDKRIEREGAQREQMRNQAEVTSSTNSDSAASLKLNLHVR